MISRYKHLVLVFLLSKPVSKLLYLFILASVREISSMDQDVTFANIHEVMRTMCVSEIQQTFNIYFYFAHLIKKNHH